MMPLVGIEAPGGDCGWRGRVKPRVATLLSCQSSVLTPR
jgi:hypothetical protein